MDCPCIESHRLVTSAVTEVRRAVRESLIEVPADAPVIVACSGGADSLALAAAVAWVAETNQRLAGAVVVDHALVPGSDGVAARAAAQCEALGLLPVVVRRVDATARPGGAGPEGAAREARRTALLDEAQAQSAAAILLGHTLDDQAETVLLGLARGSGGRSLSGMAPVTGPFRRPLLGVARSVVRQSVIDLGLEPAEDPQNRDPHFARVRVRETVLPMLEQQLGPGIAQALARTAQLLRADTDVIHSLAHTAMSDLGAEPQIEALRELPEAVRTRVLRHMAIAAGCRADALSRDHITMIDRLVCDPRVSGPIDLPSGIAAHRRYGRLVLETRKPTAKES
jgi:tRNA(Ile)-lysidine synthase